MKITRYVITVAGIVAILAATAWFLRNDLIQRLSNPLLADYDLTIVDVSLDALATGDASISYLELVHEKGTTIVIESLTLPFAAASKQAKTYRAGKVSIVTATRQDGEAFDMAELIRQALSLPDDLANSAFVVGEFSLPPYPIVHDVRWEIADNSQRLHGSVASVDLSATLARAETGGHDVMLSVPGAQAAGDGNTLALHLLDEGDQLSLTGDGPLNLPSWEPLAKLVEIVPPELGVAAGTATLKVDVEIPNDPAQIPTLAASFIPTSELGLSYRNDQDIASIRVRTGGITHLSAEFPNVDWSLQLAEAVLTISYGAWTEVPLSLTDVACRSGPTCSLTSRVTISERQLPVGKIAHLEFSSTEMLHFPDSGVRIDLQPGATLRLNNLRSEAGGLQGMRSELVSPATLNLDDAGWRLSAASVDAKIDSLRLGEDFSASLSLFLENAIIGGQGETLSFSSGVFAPSSRATRDGRTIALPGFKGAVSFQDGTATAELQTVGLQKEAVIQVRHKLASATGKATVNKGTASFAKTSLSDRVSPWPYDHDLVAGAVSFDFSANWAEKNARLVFNAEAAVAATNLAGFYGDTAFTGVATQLAGRYRGGTGFVVEPATVTASLVEIGIPVEGLSADYLLDLNTLSVDVENLRMSAFGGIVTADPFSFRTDRAVNTLTLNTASLDLTELLSLKGFEAVQVTGSVNARLPITLEGDTVTIESGALTGNPPGGVIRYRPANPRAKSDVSSVAFVERVLSNFEYETMASDVNLSKAGDLLLNLKLTGRNPDLNEKRPVVLNIGVENNIPQMLRSLRTTRAVEDVLERRLGK